MSESNCPPCVHCGRRKGNRNRGLCWVCSLDRAVRALYPSKQVTSDYAWWNRKPAPSKEPTSALPGTPEKELVLTLRAEAFQELWHPEDALPDED